MAPNTEFATLPLKAGLNISDPNTAGGSVFQLLLTTILNQPGAQRVYWGLQIENPSELELFIDWDSYEAHKSFRKSSSYGPFSERFSTILDGDAQIKDFAVSPHPPTSVLSDSRVGVTEIFQAWFPRDVSQSTKDEMSSNVDKFFDNLGELPGRVGTISKGWAAQDDIPFPNKSGNGTVFIAMIGWDSLDSHMKVRQTPAYKDNIKLLREIKGLQGTTMILVKAKQQDASGLGSVERS